MLAHKKVVCFAEDCEEQCVTTIANRWKTACDSMSYLFHSANISALFYCDLSSGRRETTNQYQYRRYPTSLE
jgi:hypothetical protein